MGGDGGCAVRECDGGDLTDVDGEALIIVAVAVGCPGGEKGEQQEGERRENCSFHSIDSMEFGDFYGCKVTACVSLIIKSPC